MKNEKENNPQAPRSRQEPDMVYQNEKVKHSAHCHSIACLLGETKPKHEHCSLYCFETKKTCYVAESLHEAAMMWVRGGVQELVEVERIG